MLTAKNDGQKGPPIPSGVHEAICYTIADIGTEHSDLYGKDQRKIVLIWEVPSQRITVKDKVTGKERDLPRAISKRYTLHLGERANLRHDLASWRGRDFTPDEEKAFDLKKLLGVSCLLNVMHKMGAKDNLPYGVVSAVLPLKKKLTAENPLVTYGIEENGTDIPETLPNWVKEAIKRSPEYQQLGEPVCNDEPPPGDEEAEASAYEELDEIPF